MFDWDTWRGVGAGLLSGRAGFAGTALGLTNLGTLTTMGALNNLCHTLDDVLYPAAGDHETHDPVFVVGNARSGTTFLHRLLCADEARFFHFDTWQIGMPALVQRRCIGWLEQRDRAWLDGRLRQLMEKLDQRMFGHLQAMHPIGLTEPEEDEFLFLACFASPVLFVMFPHAERLAHLTFFDGRPEAERARLMHWYRRIVQRRAFEAGGTRRLCSKNPSFVSKLASLRTEFPEARFVYLIRDPRETIPSLLKMLRKVWQDLRVAEPLRREAEAAIAEGCVRDYLYAHDQLAAFPAETWTAVRFPDLVAQPEATVRGIYGHFGWDLSPRYAETLAAAQREARGYRSRHTYGLEEFGLDEGALREQLSPVYARFDLGRAPSPA